MLTVYRIYVCHYIDEPMDVVYTWTYHGTVYFFWIKPPKAKGTENYQTRRNDGEWPVGDFD